MTANKEATKKEAFKDLLNRLFANDEDTRAVIDAISSGAEATILNIPRQDRKHRGSADTLYFKIIVEFENDLKKTLPHAKEQLAGYLLGQVNSGEGYNYTLIASDFINWKIFAPDVAQLPELETLKEDELKLNEVESASFTLTDNNAGDFYYWIDRFLFKEEKQKATLKRIEESFGYQSPIFIQCFREMTKNFRLVKDRGEVQVSFEQWNKFLSIAYGSFVPSEQNFLIHTYLSIFAKMLAYTVVSNDDYIDDAEMREVIDGSIFHKFNITNFVENDFYHWILGDDSFPALKKSFRLIAQELSSYDFFNVDEDVLKGVYQEMIDLDTRHALGEYYTPDWLCERIVSEFNLTQEDKILDPACGSGSFLRAIIDRLRTLNPAATVEDINDQVYGIDIHPLSVQIAKTTLLLALGRGVAAAKKPIHLNIVLANTLLTPQGVETLYGHIFEMQIDRKKYSLDTGIFEDVHLFDEALSLCEELATQTQNQKEESVRTFARILKKLSRRDIIDAVAESFYQIYLGFKQVKEQGRDSIWRFIVQNLYKPYFLANKFDYVIGNPPWLTFSDINNETYQDLLENLAEEYDVKPDRKANMPHLEIAAIFLAYCSSYFLKASGQISFVLPRGFISADHHDNTRSGRARGFQLSGVWDLHDVSPLFRVPSTVFFGKNTKTQAVFPPEGLPGKTFRGKLPMHNCNLAVAYSRLKQEEVTWFYVVRGRSSALTTQKQSETSEGNPYKKLFKQGATIVPRAFYFVDIHQQLPPDFKDRIVNLRTSASVHADAKAPWTDIDLKGRIESQFLFRTALSRTILPFAFFEPSLVVLPITIESEITTNKKVRLWSPEQLRQQGFLEAARWFSNVERIWRTRRTEKNQSRSSEEYLNWENKLTDQNLELRYLVLYTKSAKDANATVYVRGNLDLEFIVDYSAYVYYTDDSEEAYYLASILNSNTLNLLIKDFQARGLFGARHVAKKILDINYPRFNKRENVHVQLANLGRHAHVLAAEYLENNRPQAYLTPHRLGRLRLDIKAELDDEMRQIDSLVGKLISH